MAMSASFIGLRGKQEIADNLYAVFNLQTIFEPMSGMNMNGLGAIAQSNGLGAAHYLQNVPSYGDTSKAGQMFNNVAYFGISSPTYGTFTMGRQSALTSDLVVNYDPMSGANAFSAITFEGAAGGGGDTENRIFDNSYEYRLNVGPVRLAAEAQLRNGGNSTTGNAFEGDIGFDYMGFSMDFVGGKIYDCAFARRRYPERSASGVCSQRCRAGCARLWQWLFGWYCFRQHRLPGCRANTSSGRGSCMVAMSISSTQTRITRCNSRCDTSWAATTSSVVNNGLYQTDRVMQIFWAGVKYAVTPTLDVMGCLLRLPAEQLRSRLPGDS